MNNTTLAAIYVVVLIVGSAYLLFRRRTFDLFTVGFGGAVFYFSPLLIGSVPDWNGKDPFALALPLSTATYVVGLLFTSATIAGASLYDAFTSNRKWLRESSLSLANWYIGMALVGLFGSVMSGNIFDLNKTLVLTQVGYWFVLFESAAALAWVDSLFFRRRRELTVATLLLAADLAIGFRMMTVMCFLTFLLVELGDKGKIRLWRSIPFIGAAMVVAFFLMLTINNVREIALPYFGVKYTQISPEKLGKISATLGVPVQVSKPLPSQPTWKPDESKTLTKILSDLISRVPRLMWQMEPFVTQAILSETTRHHFKCDMLQIKNIALIVPGASWMVGPPVTFESQFKPVLFPNNWAGMAGNAWAEAYCDLGSAGVAIKIIVIVVLIAGFQKIIVGLNSSVTPVFMLSGVFLAFYVHRNDALFELLLIRRLVMVFVLALASSLLVRRVCGRATAM